MAKAHEVQMYNAGFISEDAHKINRQHDLTFDLLKKRKRQEDLILWILQAIEQVLYPTAEKALNDVFKGFTK